MKRALMLLLGSSLFLAACGRPLTQQERDFAVVIGKTHVPDIAAGQIWQIERSAICCLRDGYDGFSIGIDAGVAIAAGL